MSTGLVGKSTRCEPGSLPGQPLMAISTRRVSSLALRLTVVVAAAMLVLVTAASLLRMAMVQVDALAEIKSSQQIAWLALPDKLVDFASPDEQLAEILSRFQNARHVIIDFVAVDPVEHPIGNASATLPVSAAAGLFGWRSLPEPMVREVTWNGRLLGRFWVLPNPKDEIGERWRHVLVDLLLISLITVGLGLMVYWAVTRALNPLREVSSALTALGKGDLKVRLQPMDFAEFDDLPGNFNRMAVALDEAMAARRVLSDRMVVVEEQTRRQIAHALHDELSPYLVAIRPNVAVLEAATAKDPAFSVYRGSVATISAHLTATIHRIRQILETLHPPELASLGLIRAIGEISAMQEAARPGKLTISLDLDHSLQGLAESVETTLFRTVQESLTNALKHTNCSRIEVSMQRRNDAQGAGVALSIWNDGARLSEPSEGLGFGTLGIADRVRALGGELSIGPSPHRAGGWEVAVFLPLRTPTDG
ncbi:MAG: histidine kinase [Burkholderiaceae bacterium]